MPADLHDLARRVAVELRKQPMSSDMLPLTEIQRRLEASWQPDGGVLLRARSVSADVLGAGTLVTDEDRLRVVRGEVSGAGAVVRGGGFAAVRTAVGTYTVTFAPALTIPPVVTFGVGAGGINLTANASTGFSVLTFNTATGAAIDAGWTFIAIGD